ncbi:MAG: hypothetical protein KKD77_21410 [Gammaproteobacteria bacterium]|nr:hypothetical protein [Gammaproteobacteria bacterium]
MNSEQFMISVEEGHLRSKRLLIKKGAEYATAEGNRLEQFHRAGCAEGIPATQALIGMCTKQFTSIADMAKNPDAYKLRAWREKITDLRNYTHLLDGLLEDLGIE